MKNGQLTMGRRRSDTVAGAILPASPGWTRNAPANLRPQQGQRRRLPRSTREDHFCTRATHLVPVVIMVDLGFVRVRMPRRTVRVLDHVILNAMSVGVVRMRVVRL